jgi:hypothetical protein
MIELVFQVDGGPDQGEVAERLGKLPSCSPVPLISSEYRPR